MSGASVPGARLDVGRVLRAALDNWWRDFAPITLLGLLLLVLPEFVLRVSGAPIAPQDNSTLVATVRALMLLMFVSAVTTASLRHPPPPGPGAYMLAGLKNMQPALVVGLTVAAAIVGVLIVGRLLALFFAPALAYLALPGILAILVFWLLALPIAAYDRDVPFRALARAGRMAAPHKWRLLLLIGAVAAALLPPLVFLLLLIFNAKFAGEGYAISLTVAPLTPLTAGFWILQLFGVLAMGLIATIPATLYKALKTA